MTVNTKFNEGDRVFTIDPTDIKVREFIVGKIIAYVCDGKTSVTLYPQGSSYMATGYNEDKCFPTEAMLLNYVTTKCDAETL